MGVFFSHLLLSNLALSACFIRALLVFVPRLLLFFSLPQQIGSPQVYFLFERATCKFASFVENVCAHSLMFHRDVSLWDFPPPPPPVVILSLPLYFPVLSPLMWENIRSLCKLHLGKIVKILKVFSGILM